MNYEYMSSLILFIFPKLSTINMHFFILTKENRMPDVEKKGRMPHRFLDSVKNIIYKHTIYKSPKLLTPKG